LAAFFAAVSRMSRPATFDAALSVRTPKVDSAK
jgi:hypothetical protein